MGRLTKLVKVQSSSPARSALSIRVGRAGDAGADGEDLGAGLAAVAHLGDVEAGLGEARLRGVRLGDAPGEAARAGRARRRPSPPRRAPISTTAPPQRKNISREPHCGFERSSRKSRPEPRAVEGDGALGVRRVDHHVVERHARRRRRPAWRGAAAACARPARCETPWRGGRIDEGEPPGVGGEQRRPARPVGAPRRPSMRRVSSRSETANARPQRPSPCASICARTRSPLSPGAVRLHDVERHVRQLEPGVARARRLLAPVRPPPQQRRRSALAARSRSRTATAIWSRASIMTSRDLTQRLQAARGCVSDSADALLGQVRDAGFQHAAGRLLVLQRQEHGERERPAALGEIAAALRAPAVAAGEVMASNSKAALAPKTPKPA